MNRQQVGETRPDALVIVAIVGMLLLLICPSISNGITGLREEATRRPMLSAIGRNRRLGYCSYPDSGHSFLHRGDPYQTSIHGRV